MSATPRSGTATPLGTNLKPLDVRAADATLYIPTPLHPSSEAYAERAFKRVLRPVDGWTHESCLRECDAVCA